jgi:hypothetical protein
MANRRLFLAVLVLATLCAVSLAILLFVPPVFQDPNYHHFAGRQTLLGIPNFWNVVSNAAFLAAVAFGIRALHSESAFTESWERNAFCILLAGTAMVAFGSAYYHLRPNSTTLFWDRLPMTVVFMSLFAATIGERISLAIGRRCLLPLLAAGGLSVGWWRATGDLRLYGIVQFYPMIAIPLLLILLPPRYSGSAGLFATIGLYGIAKLFELFDWQMTAIVSSGGHPWKHLAAAAALLCYVTTVARRRPLVENNSNAASGPEAD